MKLEPGQMSHRVRRSSPWSPTPSASLGKLPAPRTNVAAGTLDGHVYVTGGRGATAGSQTQDVVGVGMDGGRCRTAALLALGRDRDSGW